VQKLHITHGPLAVVGSLDMDNVGYAILALFALTWVVAVLVWRFGRIEERLSRPTEA
jgi:high-affinity nickel-transport protein